MKKILKFILAISYPIIHLVILTNISVYGQSLEEGDKELTSYEREIVELISASVSASTQGPNKIKLIDQGSLNLPEGYLFVPEKEGRAFMELIGNRCGPEFLGLITSQDNPFSYFIIMDFVKTGYIRDGDARNLKPEEMFEVIKSKTEEGNKKRVEQSLMPLKFTGWINPPAYNSTAHHLTWSILGYEGTSPQDSIKNANYASVVLGREGVFQLRLVVTDDNIKEASNILSALELPSFKPGKTYADFCEDTDHIAEYGLIALVTGIAAKKMGLLAGAGIFLAKIWKFLILAGVLLLAKSRGSIKAFFKNRKKNQNELSDENRSNFS